MTNNLQRTYEGTVVTGVGNMSKRMSAGSVALKVYEEATGCKLVPGSLNVELAQEIDMPSYSQKLTREDHEGTATILMIPAFVNGIPGFAVRNLRAEEGRGRHSKRVVEVISAHNLRKVLQVRDGDKVVVVF